MRVEFRAVQITASSLVPIVEQLLQLLLFPSEVFTNLWIAQVSVRLALSLLDRRTGRSDTLDLRGIIEYALPRMRIAEHQKGFIEKRTLAFLRPPFDESTGDAQQLGSLARGEM